MRLSKTMLERKIIIEKINVALVNIGLEPVSQLTAPLSDRALDHIQIILLVMDVQKELGITIPLELVDKSKFSTLNGFVELIESVTKTSP